MTVRLRGIYRDGTVILLDAPPELQEGPVDITLSTEGAREPAFLQYGKYADGTPSTGDDFRVAEWRGEDIGDGA